MNKVFSLVLPVAVALSASLGCATTYAASSQMGISAQQATQAVQQAPVAETATKQQNLTRRAVYNQLVQAEKDGQLARVDATVFAGG